MADPPSWHALWAAGEARLTAAGLDDARLVAEALLRHASGLSRVQLLRDLRAPAWPDATRRYDALLSRAAAGEPLAYIVGAREFFGLTLAVDRRVLIPRPETETLVELGVAECRELRRAGVRQPLVAEVGTGSGAIALAVAHTAPFVRVVASDVSLAALAVARRNVARLGPEHAVSLVAANLLSAWRGCPDVVLANLPYIPAGRVPALDPWIRDWEPHLALAGGPDGLDLYRRLVEQWHDRWLELAATPSRPPRDAPRSTLLFEIGSDQVDGATELVRERAPAATVSVHADLGGAPRVVRAVLTSPPDLVAP